MDAPAHEVADLLSLDKSGAMPVVDDGKLVGLISYIDFLKQYAAQRLSALQIKAKDEPT